MGYTTEYSGSITLNKKLDDETFSFLSKLASTRRMKRKLGPEYGVEGEYFVDGEGDFGQTDTPDVVDHNTPPSTQPGLWCNWEPNNDRINIEGNGGEKWMDYILNNILAPKGYIGNGTIEAQGEETSDHWWLNVHNNLVTTVSMTHMIEKYEAYDILVCPYEDLPTYVGLDLYPLAKETLKKRLDGKIKVQITD